MISWESRKKRMLGEIEERTEFLRYINRLCEKGIKIFKFSILEKIWKNLI